MTWRRPARAARRSHAAQYGVRRRSAALLVGFLATAAVASVILSIAVHALDVRLLRKAPMLNEGAIHRPGQEPGPRDHQCRGRSAEHRRGDQLSAGCPGVSKQPRVKRSHVRIMSETLSRCTGRAELRRPRSTGRGAASLSCVLERMASDHGENERGT